MYKRQLQDSLFITNNIQPKIILETMSIEIEKKVALACDAVTICPLNYIENTEAVSYTHLDVYKRQRLGITITSNCWGFMTICMHTLSTILSSAVISG